MMNETMQPPSPARRRVWLGVAAAAALAGVGVASWRFREAPVAPGAEAALWSMQFDGLDGRPVAMAALRGKPLLVNFWATWCPPCVEEMPELEALQQELQAKSGSRVQTIGIGIDSPSNIRQFASKSQISYPLMLAGSQGSELARLFGNDKGLLPYTVVIGQDGSMLKTVLGRVRIDSLRQTVLDALGRA